MSFLGTSAGFPADLTLIVQIAGIIILLYGVIQAKRKNFPDHIKIAEIAVVLGIIAFLWMGSSFLLNFRALISGITRTIIILTWFHAAVGSLAIAGGILFVSNKIIKKTVIPMRSIFLLWVLAFLLGILMYIQYYIG